MKKKNVYSKYDQLPDKMANNVLTPGCLALEGGSFRGAYTAGVLDVFMENDINLQTVIGVSAGCLTGYNYAAGAIGRTARVNISVRHDHRYVGYKSFITDKGLIGFHFMFNECEDLFPYSKEMINSPKRRYIAVATSCLTGETMYFEKGKTPDLFKAMQASCSMPYYTRVTKVEGIPCLDGGCSVKVPYKWALNSGYEKIVVVKTLPRDHFRPEKKNKDNFARIMYHRYPEFVKVLKGSAPRSNAETEELVRLEKEGRIFLIAPPSGFLMNSMEGDMEKMGGYYEQGVKDGEEALPALKEYLGI